ncbi:MAG: hypothetical protein CM15mV13_0680 [uncultured marine virus]|nr:MAG: hypothetical protein CM15mV13_0680 [uncultured marine virus]
MEPPKLIANVPTLSVDKRVASELGNLIVLVPVILSRAKLTLFWSFVLSINWNSTADLFSKTCCAFSVTILLMSLSSTLRLVAGKQILIM